MLHISRSHINRRTILPFGYLPNNFEYFLRAAEESQKQIDIYVRLSFTFLTVFPHARWSEKKLPIGSKAQSAEKGAEIFILIHPPR